MAKKKPAPKGKKAIKKKMVLTRKAAPVKSRKKASKKKPVRAKKAAERVAVVEMFEVDLVGEVESPLEGESRRHDGDDDHSPPEYGGSE